MWIRKMTLLAVSHTMLFNIPSSCAIKKVAVQTRNSGYFICDVFCTVSIGMVDCLISRFCWQWHFYVVSHASYVSANNTEAFGKWQCKQTNKTQTLWSCKQKHNFGKWPCKDKTTNLESDHVNKNPQPWKVTTSKPHNHKKAFVSGPVNQNPQVFRCIL